MYRNWDNNFYGTGNTVIYLIRVVYSDPVTVPVPGHGFYNWIRVTYPDPVKFVQKLGNNFGRTGNTVTVW